MINNAAMVCLVAASLCGCRSASSAEAEAFQGVMELDETVLSFEASGRVARLAVKEGDTVQPNAVIGALDDELIRAERGARVLEVEAARAQAALVRAGAKGDDVRALAARVRGAQASEALLEKNLARQRRLFEQSAAPQASVDDLQSQYDRARAEREGLESQLASLKRGARSEEVASAVSRAEAAEAALHVDDERLARHALKAPIGGRVLDVHVEEGEVVAAGAPIATLGDTRRPYVEVFVPQGELAGIVLGGAATVRVDGESKAFAGRVEHIASRTEFTPRFLFSERERPNLVVRVRVRVDDPKERLHAGVPAFVTIAGARGAGGARP
jgi:HlyD family secretion protein